ncbi:hypothetical protein QJQ45_018378 [Haematococcus lacustris]|nr:hypothetical protein QJQ45_018378 [Haematococcus lacustris]
MQQPSSGTMLRRGGGAGVGGLRRSDRVVAVHRRLPHSRSLAVSRAQPLAQVIADVLNEQAKQQSGTELLSNIDSMGGSVTTTVTRIWEGEAASLKVVGSWPEGEVAKRMALLAVYQETVWRRNQLLAATFKRVLRHRPGLFPQQSTKQVLDTLAANTMNGALEALGIPELLQLAVVVVPLEQLEGVVREAVGRAGQELRARALARPSPPPPPKPSSPELRRVSAALGVPEPTWPRLRLHHAARHGGQQPRALEHLRRQAARRAAPALE